MSVVNFLFGNRQASGFVLKGVVELQADLTISEGHQRRADVTSNPVESGATIQDHVILQPETLSLEGFVSDTPAAPLAAQWGRVQSTFEALDELWRAAEPLDVVTGRKTYESMVIVDLQLPRERPASMSFSIEMQHVTIVSTQTTEIAGGTTAENASDQGTADLAQGETDAGRQPTAAASAGAGSSYTSFLGSLF
jgi:hypothetical protein